MKGPIEDQAEIAKYGMWTQAAVTHIAAVNSWWTEKFFANIFV